MGCLSFFKGLRNPKSKPGAVSTATTSSSNYDTSRTHESAGNKQEIKSSGSSSSQPSIHAMFEEKSTILRVFELAELRSATNDFSRLLKIGEGGFGSVYKGFIKLSDENSGRVTVAVKALNQRSLQGHKQWLAEVQFLGVLEHPNLVKLVGYCSDDGERGMQRLLVYEYLPNRSLEHLLFGKVATSLSWNVRLQIALGAAEGLAYLHEGLEIQVIYRDFKASNVLLDNDFKAKLSDFGLAREGPSGDKTHVSTAVVGTFGYAAPEYIETGHLTTKSDVWSFGVFLFEVLTGRRSLDRNRPKNEQKLLDWVKQFPIESKRFNMIMDPRLRFQYSLKSSREVAKLANKCLSKQPKERPKMSEVVGILKHAVEMSEEVSSGMDALKARQNAANLKKGKNAGALGS